MIDQTRTKETCFELGSCAVIELSGSSPEATIVITVPAPNTDETSGARPGVESSESYHRPIYTQNCLDPVEDLLATARISELLEIKVDQIDPFELHSKSFMRALNSHVYLAIVSSLLAVGLLWLVSFPQIMMSIAGYLIGTFFTYLIAIHGYCGAPSPSQSLLRDRSRFAKPIDDPD